MLDAVCRAGIHADLFSQRAQLGCVPVVPPRPRPAEEAFRKLGHLFTVAYLPSAGYFGIAWPFPESVAPQLPDEPTKLGQETYAFMETERCRT